MTINHDVVVVIASVPWRVDNLRALCDDIVKQTMRPRLVRLLLDGYTQELWPPADKVDYVSGNGIRWVSSANATPRGPGERWRWLAQVAVEETMPPTFAVVIDDDFRVGPDYVEKTIAGFTGPGIGMVAWSGTTWESGSPQGDGVVELWGAAAGLSAVRIAPLAGIEDFDKDRPGAAFTADDYFGIGGDDEALVSYWMWKQGLKIVRPAYPPPSIRSVDELQHDRRSAHRNHNQRHYMQRIALLQSHGWAPKDPPAWENPNATKGRTRKGP